jgi:hypothetical protein
MAVSPYNDEDGVIASILMFAAADSSRTTGMMCCTKLRSHTCGDYSVSIRRGGYDNAAIGLSITDYDPGQFAVINSSENSLGLLTLKLRS